MKKITTILIFILFCLNVFAGLTPDGPNSSGNPANSLYNGLFFYAPMDEGTGTETHPYVGNYRVGLTSTSWLVPSIHGNGLSFDGTSSFATITNSISKLNFIPNTMVFTVSCWVRFNDLTNRQVMASNASSTSHKGFWFMLENISVHTSRLRFAGVHGTVGTATVDAYADNNTITDTNWHYVAVTGDGTTNVLFYLDGVQKTTTVTSGDGTLSSGNMTQNVILGGFPGVTTTFLDGYLDELRIWNRTLSSDEIEKDYNQYLDKGVVFYAPFDEGTGDTSKIPAPYHTELLKGGNAGASNGHIQWLTNSLVVYHGDAAYAGCYDGITRSGQTNFFWVTNIYSSSVISNITVSTWFMYTHSPFHQVSLFCLHNTAASLPDYWIDVGDSSTSVGWRIEDDGGTNHVKFGGAGHFSPSEWHNITCTYDGINMIQYFDGVQSGTVLEMTNALKVSDDRAYEIGGIGTSGFITAKLGDYIDETKVWNRAFSAEEVKQNYNRYGLPSTDIATNSLVARWEFNETSGTTAQDAGSFNNDATYSATATHQLALNDPTATTVKRSVGVGGGSVTFNTNLPPTFTLSFWAYPTNLDITVDGTGGANNHVIIGGTDATGGFRSGFNTNGQYNFWCVQNNGTLNVITTSSDKTALNEWHHYAFSFDSTTGIGKIYFDGHLSATSPSGKTYVLPATTVSGIDTGVGGVGFFKGYVDDVQIFDSVLTDEELDAISLIGPK